MRILVLGGTVFLGRHIVDAAIARGHVLTLFNRGRSNPGLFPHVEQVHGDRDSDLEALADRKWDAVVDVAGYVPRVVEKNAAALAGAARHYTFVSSISAYAGLPEPGLDESAPLSELEDPATEDVGSHYGALKVACERAAEAAFPGRTLVIRPGLIVGPHDPTDRFTYWPVRVAEGGEILAPGDPARPVQFIDARDLAAWTVRMVEREAAGAFNATGPANGFSMAALLDACRDASGSDVTFRWVSEDALLESGIQPWSELPLWLPPGDLPTRGMLEVSIERALAAGLTFRPVSETARDTLEWARTRPADYVWRAGISRERERELVARFRSV